MIFVFSKISNNCLYPVLISFVIIKSLVFFLVKRAGTRKMEEPCPDKSAFAQAEQAHIANKEKQSVTAGERPVNLIVCGFLQGASGRMPPVFVLSESACGLFFWRIIRLNTQHPVADPHMGLNQMQRMCA